MTKKPFVIIPIFNEEKTIKKVVFDIKKYTNNIIIVDDGSIDNSYIEARESGAKVIKLETNKGYDYAMDIGFEYAIKENATSLISMDGDGQQPTEFLPEMISYVEDKGYDLVIGIRKEIPRISEKIFAKFTNFRYAIKDITCGMKCYKSNLVKKYKYKKNYNSIGTFLTLISISNGYKFKTIQVHQNKRLGASSYGTNLYSELKIIWAIIKSIPFLIKKINF